MMAGFDPSTIETIQLYLSAQPLLNITVKLEADEDDGDIQQGDVGHCKVGFCCVGFLKLVGSSATCRSGGIQQGGAGHCKVGCAEHAITAACVS
jgi:hypothetical protein